MMFLLTGSIPLGACTPAARAEIQGAWHDYYPVAEAAAEAK